MCYTHVCSCLQLIGFHPMILLQVDEPRVWVVLLVIDFFVFVICCRTTSSHTVDHTTQKYF